MSGTANQLVCNGCLEPIELGRSFTWFLGKPYHNHCANYTDLITRAEAEKMVQAEREKWEKLAASQYDAGHKAGWNAAIRAGKGASE